MERFTGLLLVSLFIGFSQVAVGQLNCKTVTNKEGGVTTTCYHKNGKPSSVQIWDAAHREGSMTCYNAAGKQLLIHDLRRFAGHASVYLDYYANGQVKKAEYSSAPDGGIQFWRITYTYDEAGNETSRTDMSEPDGHPVLRPMLEQTTPATTVVQPKTFPQPCAAPYSTVCRVTNTTNKSIKILMKARPNTYVQLKDSTALILPGKTLEMKHIILSQMFLKADETFEPIIRSKPVKHKKVVYVITTTEPEQQPQMKTYNWYVIAVHKT